MKSNTPIFIAKEITAGYGEQVIIRYINLELYKGEIVGLAGLIGAGRSELAQTIFGLRKSTSGEIFINNTFLKNIIINSSGLFKSQNSIISKSKIYIDSCYYVWGRLSGRSGSVLGGCLIAGGGRFPPSPSFTPCSLRRPS